MNDERPENPTMTDPIIVILVVGAITWFVTWCIADSIKDVRWWREHGKPDLSPPVSPEGEQIDV